MNWRDDATEILMQVLADDLAGGKVIITTPAEIGIIAPPLLGGWYSGAVYDCVGADDRDCVIVVVESAYTSWTDWVGVAVHEAAHWLDVGREPIPRAAAIRELVRQDAQTQQMVDLFYRLIAAVEVEKPVPSELPRWNGHGADWVRCCAILAHRAGQLVEAIRPCHLRFGATYYHAPYRENEWMTLLADEVGLPGSIRSIIAQEPPRALTEHWEHATI